MALFDCISPHHNVRALVITFVFDAYKLHPRTFEINSSTEEIDRNLYSRFYTGYHSSLHGTGRVDFRYRSSSFGRRWRSSAVKQSTISGSRTKNQNGQASATMSLTNSWTPMICSALRRTIAKEAAPMIPPTFLTSLARANKATRPRPHRLFLPGSHGFKMSPWWPSSPRRKNLLISGPRH